MDGIPTNPIEKHERKFSERNTTMDSVNWATDVGMLGK